MPVKLSGLWAPQYLQTISVAFCNFVAPSKFQPYIHSLLTCKLHAQIAQPGPHATQAKRSMVAFHPCPVCSRECFNLYAICLKLHRPYNTAAWRELPEAYQAALSHHSSSLNGSGLLASVQGSVCKSAIAFELHSNSHVLRKARYLHFLHSVLPEKADRMVLVSKLHLQVKLQAILIAT